MDCPRLASFFLLPSLSHFSSPSVFSDDVGRTFLAEWKMERPATTTTEWSVSFILSLPFQSSPPSQPLDYHSFLSAPFHSLTGKERRRNGTHRTLLLVNVSVIVAEAHLASLSRPRKSGKSPLSPTFNRFLCKFLFPESLDLST